MKIPFLSSKIEFEYPVHALAYEAADNLLKMTCSLLDKHKLKKSTDNLEFIATVLTTLIAMEDKRLMQEEIDYDESDEPTGSVYDDKEHDRPAKLKRS